jgi:hypothetical protein
MSKKDIIIGAVVAVVILAVGFFVGQLVGGNQLVSSPFRGITNYNRIVIDGNLDVGGIANASFTMATGTAKAVYTNNTGIDMICGPGSLYFKSLSTTLGASLVVGIGVSTSATGYSVSLLASTTIATTTTTFTSVPTTAASFYLADGSSIIGALSDYNGGSASSTYYGSSYWTAQFQFPCRFVK